MTDLTADDISRLMGLLDRYREHGVSNQATFDSDLLRKLADSLRPMDTELDGDMFFDWPECYVCRGEHMPGSIALYRFKFYDGDEWRYLCFDHWGMTAILRVKEPDAYSTTSMQRLDGRDFGRRHWDDPDG